MLLPADVVGVEEDGGNFTGGLGLLQRGVADLIFSTESTRYLIRDFFKVSLMIKFFSELALSCVMSRSLTN